VCYGLLGLGAAGLTYRVVSGSISKKKHDLWNKISRDYVILHQIRRGTTVPNMSAFALKLETYLRMASIPYKVDSSEPYGPRGKMPWITTEGKSFGDTELVIEYLNKRFKKNLDEKLTSDQKGIGKAVQIMMDEHFYWGMLMWRYMYDTDLKWQQLQPMPVYIKWYIKWFGPGRLQRMVWYQGLGRHTQTDVLNMMKKDLKAMSGIIGSNKFLFGNEPCEADAAAFGTLAQVVYAAPGSPYEQFILTEVPNIKTYCDNIKSTYWSDWDQVIGNQQMYEVERVVDNYNYNNVTNK